jgi:hypothetical protein
MTHTVTPMTYLLLLLLCFAVPGWCYLLKRLFSHLFGYPFTYFLTGLTQQQPCNQVVIMANKLECQTALGPWGTEANCIPNGYEMSLGVHFLSATYLDSSNQGYGHGHVLDANGNFLADFSLVYIPSSNPYLWTSFFYASIPNCTDTYNFIFTVTCIQ